MIEVQYLFDSTIEELERKNGINDEYNLLMTSSLLRKLLIDGDNSLVCQIDKKGKKLRFKVNITEPMHISIPSIFTPEDLKTYYWFAMDGLDPETSPPHLISIKEVTLDEFLQ